MADLKELQRQFHTCMPLFIALGDEVRLTIIESLSRSAMGQPLSDSYTVHGGLNVNEITRNTNLSRPAVSHHLKILKNAGLVSARKEGTSNYYYLTIADGVEALMRLGRNLQQILNQG